MRSIRLHLASNMKLVAKFHQNRVFGSSDNDWNVYGLTHRRTPLDCISSPELRSRWAKHHVHKIHNVVTLNSIWDWEFCTKKQNKMATWGLQNVHKQQILPVPGLGRREVSFGAPADVLKVKFPVVICPVLIFSPTCYCVFLIRFCFKNRAILWVFVDVLTGCSRPRPWPSLEAETVPLVFDCFFFSPHYLQFLSSPLP